MNSKFFTYMLHGRGCKLFLSLTILFLSLFLISCKQEFKPRTTSNDLSLLIVDGFLNNSSDSTFIRLSRSRRLSDGLLNSGEKNAQVSIEDIYGTTLYNFQQKNTDGVYYIPGMNLDVNNKYRLRINTLNGNQYLSDELPVNVTPSIDSINWKRTDDGVTIYANTHDPQNKTQYYRWDYTETWEYHSPHYSTVKYVGGGILDRTNDELIYACWLTQNSTDILLASSAKLSEDIIYETPLRFIPMNAYELSVKYSIMLRQYAITKEAFLYLENLKKITEQMGSIFDAQPSQLTGNMHSVNNPTETVLGFMSLSTLDSARKFISNVDVRPWRTGFYCERKEVPPDSIDIYFGEWGYIPIDKNMMGLSLISVGGAQGNCVDCRMRGGALTKPGFWP